MKIMRTKGFDKSIANLHRQGGPYQRAATQVHALLGRINIGHSNPFKELKLTKHGEKRIKKCRKYDLEKFCRLITVCDGGYVFLCYIGKHQDCDEWIEENRGLKIKVGTDMRPVSTYESHDINNSKDRLDGRSEKFYYQLLNKLPGKLLDNLLIGIDSILVSNLKEISSLDDEEKILELATQIKSSHQSTAVYDTLTQLKKGQLQYAQNTINVFSGNLKQLPESSKLNNSEDFQALPHDSEQYRKLIEHYSKTANYRDWMLFMHPDQEKFINATYSGPSKISGVSGSGKTCVVVKRSIHLAELYPTKKVLVLTLNRSLAALIKDLVDTAATLESVRDRIDVLPFFGVCQNLLREFEPENWKLYDDETWKSREHIDEVWMEYYRCELNNHDAQVMQKVHDSLIARGIDAEAYIREEFDWIRSAVSPDNRLDYLALQRTGRSYSMDETFRTLLLEGLVAWEKKMREIGVSDYLGLATAINHHIKKIQPKYRSILIDESQDFGTIELQVIRQLAEPQQNDLFFCGDAAQQVSSKHQDFKLAEIYIPSARSKKLLKNYRNTGEILTAAYDVLVNNLSAEMIDNKEFDVLDPDHSDFNGPIPLLLAGDSLSQEISAAKYYIKQELNNDPKQKACIVFCGHTLHEMRNFGKRSSLPVLDGTRSIDDQSIFVSDLENSKGFEFQIVCILNCSSTVIPYPGSPENEQFRDLSRLYVAMTRSRTQLILSYTGSLSGFFRSEKAKENFLEDTWLSYLNIDSRKLKLELIPQKLEEVRLVDNKIPFAEMTGEQFLYTDDAISLDIGLIEKIRKLINGKQHMLEGRKVSWRNFAEAATDVTANASARRLFGKDLELFKKLLESKELL